MLDNLINFLPAYAFFDGKKCPMDVTVQIKYNALIIWIESGQTHALALQLIVAGTHGDPCLYAI